MDDVRGIDYLMDMNNRTDFAAATLTLASAIEHGLAAEIALAGGSRARLSISAKSAGDLLRFLAACGLDIRASHGVTTREWGVYDQTGTYCGSVLAADSVPGYALFSGVAS